ncbi:hypothetical protein, partial [Burkholderia pseudomallei]|uniref:hypothetical protein n=1 Tax=Burkholderia pseudomallei TaxID=28450 RepID=UPI001CA5448E
MRVAWRHVRARTARRRHVVFGTVLVVGRRRGAHAHSTLCVVQNTRDVRTALDDSQVEAPVLQIQQERQRREREAHRAAP